MRNPMPDITHDLARHSTRHGWRALTLTALVTLASLLLAACGAPGTVHSGTALPQIPAATSTQAALPPVTFPLDEAPHHNLTEWWYYTGHLHGTDAQGKAHVYGFELTFFQTLRSQFAPFYAAHFAISDISAGQFQYDERAGFEPPSVIPNGSTSGFNLALQGWSAQGLNGHDTLASAMSGYSIQVSLTDALPHAILHNGNGLISYGPAGYSYYYSRPLMMASGVVVDHGVSMPVSGQAWMDHQWGDFLTIAGGGWDWYSIQLSNHTEYMLYVIRDAQKRPIGAFGTAVAADGAASEIPPSAIQTQATRQWTSPVTNGVYPSGWTVSLPSQQVTLTLTPLLVDQELVTARSTGVAYWEGAVAISGQQAGKPLTGEGYVELTGYASVPASAQSATAP